MADALIETPAFLDPMAAWEAHLARLEAQQPRDELWEDAIAAARRTMALKRELGAL